MPYLHNKAHQYCEWINKKAAHSRVGTVYGQLGGSNNNKGGQQQFLNFWREIM